MLLLLLPTICHTLNRSTRRPIPIPSKLFIMVLLFLALAYQFHLLILFVSARLLGVAGGQLIGTVWALLAAPCYLLFSTRIKHRLRHLVRAVA